MKAPSVMAAGAFLLVFGLIFTLYISVIVNEIYGYFYNYQTSVAYCQLAGIIVAAMGAGFLAYGYGLDLENRAQPRPSA